MPRGARWRLRGKVRGSGGTQRPGQRPGQRPRQGQRSKHAQDQRPPGLARHCAERQPSGDTRRCAQCRCRATLAAQPPGASLPAAKQVAGSGPEGRSRRKRLPCPRQYSMTPKRNGILRAVAVGTALTGRPPHRSQRAGLPHWAPALDSDGESVDRIWVADSRFREPAVDVLLHAVPGDVGLVTAEVQGALPEPSDTPAKAVQRSNVERHAAVPHVSFHDTSEPLPDHWDRVVYPPSQLAFDLRELSPHSLLDRPTFHPKFPRSPSRTDVRESEKVKGPGFPWPAIRVILDGVATKLHEPGLFRMKLESEVLQSLLQLPQTLS